MTIKATDYSKYKRVVIIEGNRVRGELAVLRAKDLCLVTPLDLVVWNETRTWGSTLYSKAFTALVKDGSVDLGRLWVEENLRYEVEEVLDELKECILAAVELVVTPTDGEEER